MRRVVCAAVRGDDGKVFLGARHGHALERYREARPDGADPEQGFVDQKETFLTREEAREIAVNAGQVTHRCGGDDLRLYSENLY